MTTTTSDGGAGSGPPIGLGARIAYLLIVAIVEVVARLTRGRR